MKYIIGAGLAGLLAAHAWPSAHLLEAAPSPAPNHRALLRFRSDSVSRLTGIEFRRVRVNKAIWLDGAYSAPSIRASNLYSRKILSGGFLTGDRSIWDIAPVDRFIAPETLYEQLLESVGARVSWGTTADFEALNFPTVNTAPLPVVLSELNIPTGEANFHRAPIYVRRWKIPRCDLFQTIYFPELDNPIYRASITKDLLIIEQTEHTSTLRNLEELERAFGISLDSATELGTTDQKYGKILPIDDTARKAFLFRLTHDHSMYSLGRFATWRNILLDDVVNDIAVIKKLSRIGAAYDLRAAAQ
jgi:hypothetical protein